MTATRRVTALAAALAFFSAGSGLPMCLTLVLRLAEPCVMHEGHGASHAGHAAHGIQLSAAGAGETCHPAHGTSAGCIAGGACPEGSVAAPEVLAPATTLADLWEPAHGARLTAPASFLAPPLAPPPQA